MRIATGSVDRYVYFVAVDSTDLKTKKTGLTTFTVYASRNGAASAAFTAPTINETDATNMPGVYELLLDEQTTITAGHDSEELCLHITQAAMAPVTRVVELYRPETTEGNTLDVTATGAAGIDWGNIQNTAAVNDLSSTDIQLCDTVTINTDMRGTDAAATAVNLASAMGAGFLESTDSLEAIRNQGDVTWKTGPVDRRLLVDTLVVGLTSQTVFNLSAGSGDDNAYNGCSAIIENATTSVRKSIGLVKNYVGATKTVTLVADPGVFVVANNDRIYILADVAVAEQVLEEALVTHATTGTLGKTIADINTNADVAISTRATVAGVWANGSRSLTNLGAALVAEIWDALTTGMVTASSIGKKLSDLVLGTDNRVLVSIDENVKADIKAINGSATAPGKLGKSADEILDVTVVAGITPTSTTFKTNLTSTQVNNYIGRTITFNSGMLIEQSATITASDAAGLITVGALTSAPSIGDTLLIH